MSARCLALFLLLLLSAQPGWAQPTPTQVIVIGTGSNPSLVTDNTGRLGIRVTDSQDNVILNGGSVQLYVNGALNANIPLPTGQTSIPFSTFGTGFNEYYAVFVPTDPLVYSTSTSNTLHHTVGTSGGPQTATTLSVTVNPAQVAEPNTLTAQVTGMAGNAVTGGTVDFLRNGAPFTSGVTVSGSGQATVSLAGLGLGSHNFTATYNPDAGHDASTSSVLTQVVTTQTTTTTVTSSANPSTVGDTVTFTATLTALNAPTGTVTFTVNGTAQAPSTLSPVDATTSAATFATSSLAAGSHSVTAQYSGAAFHATSSGSLSPAQQVRRIPTLAIESSANPSVSGQAVTLNVTVTGTGATPTGTVTFSYGGGTLNPQTLVGGSASIVVPAANLTVGTWPVSFTYSGDTNYAPGAGGTLTGGQVINQASTTTLVTSSLNPAQEGQAVTFTATVAAAAPGAGTPGGTVTFTVDGGTGIPVTLAGGSATFAPSLTGGSHTITATYGGSAEFLTSSGSVLQTTTFRPNEPNGGSSPIYAFGLQSLGGPATAAPGTTGTFRLQVSNTGNRNDTYRLTLSGDSRARLSTDVLAVGAGGTGEVLVTLTLPADANPGAVRLFVAAVSENTGTRSTLDLTTRISGLATFSLRLNAGWNGVGFESGTLTELASNPLVVGLARLRNGAYETLPFTASSVTSTMEGYWVFSQGPTTVSYSGAVVSDGSVALREGWNLVAFPCDGPARVSGELLLMEIQADGSYKQVEGTVTPGRAYWVFARQAMTVRYAR